MDATPSGGRVTSPADTGHVVAAAGAAATAEAADDAQHFWGDTVYEQMAEEAIAPGRLDRCRRRVDDARDELADAKQRLCDLELEEVARALPVPELGPGWRRDPYSRHCYYSAAWIDRP